MSVSESAVLTSFTINSVFSNQRSKEVYFAFCITCYFLANVNVSSRSLYVIVRPSVCRLSVTFVRPTQAIEIFGNVSTPFGTLAIC